MYLRYCISAKAGMKTTKSYLQILGFSQKMKFGYPITRSVQLHQPKLVLLRMLTIETSTLLSHLYFTYLYK